MEIKIKKTKRFVRGRWQTRWIIIDIETNKCIDAAGGCGYKSEENARRAWEWKQENRKQS